MYQVQISLGLDVCGRIFAYTVLQTVQMRAVYSNAYVTVQ